MEYRVKHTESLNGSKNETLITNTQTKKWGGLLYTQVWVTAGEDL